MYFELKDATADILARSRRHDELCDLPLQLTASESEAYDIQAAAQDALGFERKGYAVVGSTEGAQRALSLTSPIFAVIPVASFLHDTTELRLPPGATGVQCEFVFTMLRPNPDAGEHIDLVSAREAILACRPAIGLLGRRARKTFAGNNAAMADFGLHVATLCGNHVPAASLAELASLEVTAFLFKETVLFGKASSIMDNPVNAVVWIARQLVAKGVNWSQTTSSRPAHAPPSRRFWPDNTSPRTLVLSVRSTAFSHNNSQKAQQCPHANPLSSKSKRSGRS